MATVTLFLQSDWSRIVSAVVLVVVLTPACQLRVPITSVLWVLEV